jgi:DNA (cytosine-5)-methyltransferase 1
MNGLDLFSGIGGNSLGLQNYVKTIAYCEADRHAQSVLLSRMADGKIGRAPIWDDITTLRGSMFSSRYSFGNVVPIDIITGGFPCQDISTAGRGAGLEGKRSGLFFELCRLVKEINPRFVFLENVPAVRARGLRTIIREFTDLGYDCRWTCVSAKEVGASHLRKRWFLLAHANGKRLQATGAEQPASRPIEQSEWPAQPDVGRVAYGIPP